MMCFNNDWKLNTCGNELIQNGNEKAAAVRKLARCIPYLDKINK